MDADASKRRSQTALAPDGARVDEQAADRFVLHGWGLAGWLTGRNSSQPLPVISPFLVAVARDLRFGQADTHLCVVLAKPFLRVWR
jgi:hypothetical protein